MIQRDYVVLQEAEGAGKRTTLGDVAHIVTGQSPPGGTVSRDKGLPLLNGPTEFGPHHPTPAQFTTDARKKAKPGDVLFCVRGSTTGRMNWADREYAIGRGVAAIRHCQGHDLQPMLRGVIEHHLPDLLAQATGSTFPNVSGQQLAAIPYPDIGVDEQRAIAHVLGTLDDKIELNRRMNETLEAMARALFRSWFVDLEPVRAKMEGRWRPGESLPGLPAHLHPLFPDRLVPSELGDIPEGWQVRGLDGIADFTNGLALQRFPPDGDEWLPVIKIAEMRRGYTEKTGKASASIDPRYIVEDGDVLFSWSGSLELVLWSHGRGALNQHLFKVTSDEFPRWFYWGWLHEHIDDFRGIAAGKATTMGHIQRHHLTDAKVAVPPEELLEAANGMLDSLVEQQVAHAVQNRDLATVRDTLLPRLVSGGLRVEHMSL